MKDFLFYGSDHNTLTDEAKRRDRGLFKFTLVMTGILLCVGMYYGFNFLPVPGAFEGAALGVILGTRGKALTYGWMGWMMILSVALLGSAGAHYSGFDIYYTNEA